MITLLYLPSVSLSCCPWVDCLEPVVYFLAGVVDDQAHPEEKVPFDIDGCQNVILHSTVELLKLWNNDFIQVPLDAEIDVDAEEGSNSAKNYECRRFKVIEQGRERD